MELFGVGIGEAGLVFLIALLVVGPERFPQIAREAGKWYRMARRFTAEVTADLQGALKELEDEVNQQGGDLKAVREIGDEVRAGMRANSDDITSIGRSVGAAASEADLSKPGAPIPEPPTAPANSPTEGSGLGVVQSNPDLFAVVRSSYADLHTPAAPVPTSPEVDPDEMAQHASEAFEEFRKTEQPTVVSGGNPFANGAESPPATGGASNGTQAAAKPGVPTSTPATPRTDA